MNNEQWTVALSGPCVSPFDSRPQAEAFARELQELISRYTDEPMDVRVCCDVEEAFSFGQVF